MKRRQQQLNIAQIVLLLIGCAMFLLSSGKIPASLGWPFPWYFSVVFFFGALACGFYASKSIDEAERQRARAHMAGRPALSDSEFGKQHFPPDRSEVAAKLRQILRHHISVDLSQMHPDDRFIEDLRMDALDSLSTVEYVIEIEEKFSIKIPNEAAEKMATFQSVVDYVAEAVKTKAN
ncbi:MAG: acyl carrier protein [Verrucomicrobia bacterium]|nr:acyl carrier protein [Verrucomicrobiota bacterium]